MVPLCQCHEMTGPRPRGDARLKMSAARGYAEYLDAMPTPTMSTMQTRPHGEARTSIPRPSTKSVSGAANLPRAALARQTESTANP
jgi:hypothetical protein